MNLDQVTQLFKWMTIINVVVFILSSVLAIVLKDVTCRMHARLFGIQEKTVASVAYGYLGGYRLLILVLNIVPYISLLLVG